MFGLYKIRGAIEGGVMEREKQGKKSRWGMGSWGKRWHIGWGNGNNGKT